MFPIIDQFSTSTATLAETAWDIAASVNGHLAMLVGNANIPGEAQTLIGWNPFLILSAHGCDVRIITAHGDHVIKENPFEALHAALHEYRHLSDGGCFVALGYDLKDQIEQMPSRARNDLHLPDLYALFCSNITRVDLVTNVAQQWKTEGEHLRPIPFVRSEWDAPTTRELQSTFSKDAYLTAVQRAIHHIYAGDVYQLNLAQRFRTAPAHDGFSLLRRLHAVNPAPMAAFVRAPGFDLISNSPERFLRRRGEVVSAHPIKGTRPRGRTTAEDAALHEELLHSSKDCTELAMIVDLLRNDLGRLALPRSVRVANERCIHSYADVFHAIATVEARMPPDVRAVDIIRSCFPCGSITGCPKVRAMELIEEIEPVRRGFAYGSVGFLDFSGDFDLNVAIRTFVNTPHGLHFHLGGGIVADSIPMQEYEETLHKGRSMFDVLRHMQVPC